MSKNIEIIEYDTAMFLDNDELIIEYLEQARNEGDDAFLEALATVARAKGMKEFAQNPHSQKTWFLFQELYSASKKDNFKKRG